MQPLTLNTDFLYVLQVSVSRMCVDDDEDEYNLITVIDVFLLLQFRMVEAIFVIIVGCW